MMSNVSEALASMGRTIIYASNRSRWIDVVATHIPNMSYFLVVKKLSCHAFRATGFKTKSILKQTFCNRALHKNKQRNKCSDLPYEHTFFGTFRFNFLTISIVFSS